MPAHEFEKNVQQKMDDLKIVPSQAVWSRVEQEIRRDKRRRRLLLALPLLLVIGLGVYWAMQQPEKSSVVKTEKSKFNDKENTITDPASAGNPPSGTSEQNNSKPRDIKTENDQLSQKPASVKADERSLTTTTTLGSSSNKPNDNSTVSVINKQTKNKQNLNKYSSYSNRKRADDISSLSVASQKKLSSKEVRTLLNQNGDPLLYSKEDEKEIVLKPFLKIFELEKWSDASTTIDSIDDIYYADKVIPFTEPLKKVLINPSVPRTWHWGIVANVGVSKLVDGTLLGAFEKSLPMSSRPLSVADANGRPGPLGIPSLPAKAADINPGLSTGIGFFIKKEFKGNLALSSGLSYSYYSTKAKIGNRIDTSRIINNSYNYIQVNGYYANAGNNNYTSKYHFIELPLTLDIRLNPRKRLPITATTGLSLGYLFATNALHYDAHSGVYYKDNSLFNQTQLGFNAGLSVTLFPAKKYKLELGPQFNYKLGNMLKSKDGNSAHMLSAGINARWYLR